MVPLAEGSDLVAFSESDSMISPSDGEVEREAIVRSLLKKQDVSVRSKTQFGQSLIFAHQSRLERRENLFLDVLLTESRSTGNHRLARKHPLVARDG